MKKNVINSAVYIAKGIVIGIGAILPGISGGVLAMIFGIYKPTMNFLAHPIRNRRLLIVLAPAGIGGILGMVLFARLVEWLFHNQYGLAVWLFVGLIAGTLPGLWREAGRYRRSTASWVALGASFVVLLTALFLLERSGAANVQPSTFWWAVCGALWGVALIVPGLSHSSLLVFLGLYEPMAAGIASLSIPVILPMALGLLVTLLLLARLVKLIFDRTPSVAYHCILGIILASTVAIIPAWQGWLHALYSALSLAIGVVISTAMGAIDKTVSKTAEG